MSDNARDVDGLRAEVACLRSAIVHVLTLPIRGKYIALPVSMRDALQEAYYSTEKAK